jgi:hypothetical protein
MLAKFVWDPLPTRFVCLLSGLRTVLGMSATQAQAIQTTYNSSQQELEEPRAAALEACQGIKEGEVHDGSSMVSRLRALGGHVTQCMRSALHLGVQKTLVWYHRTTRSTSGRSPQATSFPLVSTMRLR